MILVSRDVVCTSGTALLTVILEVDVPLLDSQKVLVNGKP